MKKILVITIINLHIITMYGQKHDVVSSAGDSFVNEHGSISWTLGECATETYLSGNLIVAQGFYQLGDSKKKIDSESDLQVNVNIFPNPVINDLNVEIEDEGEFLVSIIDQNGKVVNKKVGSREIHFDVTDLGAAQFYLNIKKEGTAQKKTKKFIKGK